MTNSNKHAREFGDSVWDDMYTSCKREEISVSQRNNFKQLYECSFIPDEHIQSNKEKIIDCVNAGRRCGKTETHFNMISNPSGNNHYYSLFKNVNE
ncbi:hypothetical protein KAU11_12130, partial [Candidatus Babeliales bacterium]|nr:hypothetical protein [Candidatus Babeliales bacterium]